MRLIHGCVVIGLSWAVASTVRGEEPVPGQDAVLESFFREYLDEAFRLEPLMATRLGDHRFDDQLDDLSSQGAKGHARTRSQGLADLSRKVQNEKLSRDGQIDYEIFRRHLERTIWLAETFQPFEDDPRIYGSYVTESVYLLLTQSSLPRAVNVKNALVSHGQDPPGARYCPVDDQEPAAGQGRDGDQANRGSHRLLCRRTVQAGGRTAGPHRAELESRADRRGLESTSSTSSRTMCCRAPAMIGGSVRPCSRTSSISSWTPACRPRRFLRKPSARRPASSRRWP